VLARILTLVALLCGWGCELGWGIFILWGLSVSVICVVFLLAVDLVFGVCVVLWLFGWWYWKLSVFFFVGDACDLFLGLHLGCLWFYVW